MLPRVKTVEPKDDFCLLLSFDNGEQRIFDVKPYLKKGIFKQLKLPAIFKSVRVVDGSVQWPNEADFCPDTLYLEGKKL